MKNKYRTQYGVNETTFTEWVHGWKAPMGMPPTDKPIKDYD